MFEGIRKALRGLGAAAMIAIVPVSMTVLAPSLAQAQAPALGVPDMGEPYPLTPTLVAAWVESYPVLLALSETLDIPAADGDGVGGFATLGMSVAAVAQMNAVVIQYGFDDFEQWVAVMLSTVFAYSVLQAPADQQPMLMGMFQQTQNNLDAVNANFANVSNLVDNL